MNLASVEVRDLDKLGVWDGWKQGKFPPYWEMLRRYIFRRDRYRCKRCHKFFRDARLLDFHHVVPKEIGGSDNPRNLATLCEKCHDLIHLGDSLFERDKVGYVPTERHSEPDNMLPLGFQVPLPTLTVNGQVYRMSQYGKFVLRKLNGSNIPNFGIARTRKRTTAKAVRKHHQQQSEWKQTELGVAIADTVMGENAKTALDLDIDVSIVTAATLREFRRRTNWSANQLASELMVSRTYIKHLESETNPWMIRPRIASRFQELVARLQTQATENHQ